MEKKRTIVVIPSDPIDAYEQAGYDWLERYYNPKSFFDEVYALSPLEPADRFAHGMHIKKVHAHTYKRELERIRPDVVRAYGGYWACDLACYNKIPGIPVIASVHDKRPSMVHRSIVFADMVICMSRVVADLVASYGVRSECIRILPNRVDLDTFTPQCRDESLKAIQYPLPDGKCILHVGRKSEEKNITTVLQALALLPDDYFAVFIGSGDPEPYTKIADDFGVASRCHWIESVRNNQLPFWYSLADCFCTPSVSEGFGLVFIEAAACGAAIVTSDIAPMNEYLKNDVNALLVTELTNPEHIAGAIKRVCTDIAYSRRIRSAAPFAAAVFSKNTVDAQECSLYEEAMSEGYGHSGGPSTGERTRYIASRLHRQIKQSIKAHMPQRAIRFAKTLLRR